MTKKQEVICMLIAFFLGYFLNVSFRVVEGSTDPCPTGAILKTVNVGKVDQEMCIGSNCDCDYPIDRFPEVAAGGCGSDKYKPATFPGSCMCANNKNLDDDGKCTVDVVGTKCFCYDPGNTGITYPIVSSN